MNRLQTFLSLLLVACTACVADAQQPGTGVPPVPTLVKELHVMPYLTLSYNRFSGKAYPVPASGVGFGGGLTMDFTPSEAHSGFYMDFAFQDMRGFAANGSCTHLNDSVLSPADAYHYWQYIQFEPFLKLQNGDGRGYLLLGASLGLTTRSQTNSVTDNRTESTLWQGSSQSNPFRLDIRAGVGIRLAEFSGHQIIFEGRVGYPVTNAISDYTSACNGGQLGNWSILTVQGNLGLRF